MRTQIEYCLSRRWLQPILASLDLCQCIVQQLAPWDRCAHLRCVDNRALLGQTNVSVASFWVSARGRDLLQLPHFGEEQVKHCASKSNKVIHPVE